MVWTLAFIVGVNDFAQVLQTLAASSLSSEKGLKQLFVS